MMTFIAGCITALSFPISAATAEDLTYEIVDGEAIITGSDFDISGDLVIPATLGGAPVTAIGPVAFSSRNQLRSVVIPEGVTTIGGDAFLGCDGLQDVTLPSTLTEIGGLAFDMTPYLSSLWQDGLAYDGKYLLRGSRDLSGDCVIKAGTVLIADCAFEECSLLKSVTVPDGITHIPSLAFKSCGGLTRVTLASSVRSMGAGAFLRCGNLTEIVIPQGITEIPSDCFGWCASLQSIALPSGILSIGAGAFGHCEKLDEVQIPQSVTDIQSSAFLGCLALKSIAIPVDVTNIGTYAFGQCTALESISVAAGNPVYHSAGNCVIETARKTLVVGCKESVIPADGSVLAIGMNAFYGSSVTTLTVPHGVERIGATAFFKCEKLKTVNLPQSIKQINGGAFHSSFELTTVNYAGSRGMREQIVFFPGHGLEDVTWNYQLKDIYEIFKDVQKKDWFVKNGAADYVYRNGLFSGTSATAFGPNTKMTRGMFVTVLGRLDGVDPATLSGATRFTDVKKKQYYAPYVGWANEKGIVAGLSDTTFGPEANITREQICAMMVRYCAYADITLQKMNAPITFKDAGDISSYAGSAVAACQQGGLVNGEKVTGGYNFRPQGNATRAEVATIMMNFAKTYK